MYAAAAAGLVTYLIQGSSERLAYSISQFLQHLLPEQECARNRFVVVSSFRFQCDL